MIYQSDKDFSELLSWRKHEKIRKLKNYFVDGQIFSLKYFSVPLVEVTNNRNELKYAKSAKSDDLNLKKLTKSP